MYKEMQRPLSSEIALPRRLDAVVVLGGNVRQARNGKFVTTSYLEGPEKSIGGHARVMAARELYRRGIADRFIISTVDAAVYGQELVGYGVPAEQIILEERPTSTMEDARYSAMHLRNLGVMRAGVISSFWHLDRALEMFLREDLGRVRDLIALSADHIVAAISPKHRRIVERMMKAPTTAQRMVHEIEGIHNLRDGTYKSKPFGWNFQNDAEND